MKQDELMVFYEKARKYITSSKYVEEVRWVESLDFNKTTYEDFRNEFAFVVLSTGMTNQIAKEMFDKLVESNWNPQTVGHPGKRDSIIQLINNYTNWFEQLKSIKDDRQKVEYLQKLPFIGKITKYHLARNIGIDCAKPDRHILLLSQYFEFMTPRGMCEFLANKHSVKVGVIDIILWRYMNLNPWDVKEMKQSLRK